jgi:Uma2 family endonuclease
MTTAEYLATPETVLPRELAFGTLHVADAPLVPHQRAVGALFLALHEYLAPQQIGEVWLSPIDVVLDADKALVVQPDLLVVLADSRSIVQERIHGAPDLMIEILSPDPRVGRMNDRLQWFAQYGVRECWLLHLLDDVIEVVRFENGAIAARSSYGAAHQIQSTVLPGFDRSLGSMLD